MTATTDEQQIDGLAERIQWLYGAQLGQRPRKVTCQIFEGKVAIFLEDALTQPERLLLAQGQMGLVRQVRDCLNEILQTQIKALIMEVTEMSVVDLLIAVQLDTGNVSLLAVMATPDGFESP